LNQTLLKGGSAQTPLKDRLARALEETRAAEAHVALIEDELTEAKRNLLRLRREVLPDLFAELGVSEIDTCDGWHATLRHDVAIKPRSEAALAWLSEQDPTLVRTRLVLTMDSPDAAMMLLEANPEQLGTIEHKVHPQSLNKWARERLSSGQPIPEELFDSHPFAYVTVSCPQR